jgi:hypothetical protein
MEAAGERLGARGAPKAGAEAARVAESWRQRNQAADESSGPRINQLLIFVVTSERASEGERVVGSETSASQNTAMCFSVTL